MSKAWAILICGVALAGCTSSGDLMKTATPTVPLQFESDPPGAEVKTSGGQTCRTPCALAVPAADLQATYSLTGYQPQTVAVKLMPPDDLRGGEDSGVTANPPRFDPSPVMVELVKVPPKRSPAKKTPRVVRQPAPSAAAPQRPADAGFAPPPSTSGFSQPVAPQTPPPASAWPTPGSQVR